VILPDSRVTVDMATIARHLLNQVRVAGRLPCCQGGCHGASSPLLPPDLQGMDGVQSVVQPSRQVSPHVHLLLLCRPTTPSRALRSRSVS